MNCHIVEGTFALMGLQSGEHPCMDSTVLMFAAAGRGT
jgi:hypothetical protein